MASPLQNKDSCNDRIRVPLRDRDAGYTGNIDRSQEPEAVIAKRTPGEAEMDKWGGIGDSDKEGTGDRRCSKQLKLTTHRGRSVNMPRRFRE
jgi:hypothetical protein